MGRAVLVLTDREVSVSDLKRDLDRYFFILGTPAWWQRVSTILGTPPIWAIVDYRWARWLVDRQHWGWTRLLSRMLQPWRLLVELVTGIRLPTTARVGAGLYIGHHGGIVLHSLSVLGENCNISQGVTIGVGGRGDKRGVPSVGDRVYLGAGAKIFGKIRIGNDAAVGANAVVTIDLPDRSVATGVPARVISQRGSADFVRFRGQLRDSTDVRAD